MSTSERTRRDVLRAIVAFERPIEPLMEALGQFPFDSESELVTITADDLLRVVDRSMSGEISADQVAQWADFLEMRDDVGFEPARRDRLVEAIFELANPDINGAITPEKLSALRAELVQPAT